MAEQGASKTALGVAALRAVHQMADARPKILDDPVILQLLGPANVAQLKAHLPRFQTPASIGLRSHIVLRSRYAEDRLAKAVEQGIRQYLILGAGLDTFAYRQPNWAHTLRIYEIDQPASQREKRERLESHGIEVPSNVEFVPVDFETTSLVESLQHSSFNPARPAFVSWLGVMVYLTQEAIEEVFRFVFSLPASSEIVFTFAQAPATEAQQAMAQSASEQGEPWKNYTTPEEVVAMLQKMGFSKITLPTPEELDNWYIQGRTDGLHASGRTLLASAIV